LFKGSAVKKSIEKRREDLPPDRRKRWCCLIAKTHRVCGESNALCFRISDGTIDMYFSRTGADGDRVFVFVTAGEFEDLPPKRRQKFSVIQEYLGSTYDPGADYPGVVEDSKS